MTFKVGDLVQCKRGDAHWTHKYEGTIHTIVEAYWITPDKWVLDPPTPAEGVHNGALWYGHLIKIDPPTEGETREAYKNPKVPA